MCLCSAHGSERVFSKDKWENKADVSFHSDGPIAETCITAQVQRLMVMHGWAGQSSSPAIGGRPPLTCIHNKLFTDPVITPPLAFCFFFFAAAVLVHWLCGRDAN